MTRYDFQTAPCGCRAAPIPITTSSRPPSYNSANCPSHQTGNFRQHGTDILVPLLQPHLEEYNAYQARELPMSWQSGSTEMDAYNYEEGYSRYNRDGLNVEFPVVLTPTEGTNMNEVPQLKRAALERRARSISEPMQWYIRDQQYDDYVQVDENDLPVRTFPRMPLVAMMPAHFQPPTGPETATVRARNGNPSSRGQPSSHRSGEQYSHDRSSSGYGNSNFVAAAGGQFVEEGDERASELSVSGYIEDGVFQYEQ